MMKTKTKNLTLAVLAVCMTGALSAGGIELSRNLFAKAEETYGLTQGNFYVRGASVRIVNDEYGPGVKFHVVMEKSVYDALPESAVTGTVVLPEGLLADGESLTKETKDAESRDTTDLWFENADGNMESVIYVYDIPASNYGTDLAVVGYVSTAEKTVYSASSAVSMAWVAQEEYEDNTSDYYKSAGLEEYFTFSLTYNDGAAETVKYGEKLTEPEAPVAPEGQYFAGWANEDGSRIWDFETDVITGNTALYPKFEDKEQAKVIVLAGQSNMVGHSFAYHLPEEQLAKYRTGFENVQIYYSNNPFGTDSKNMSDTFVNVAVGQGKATDETEYPDGTFGPELGLAEYLSETYPDETFYVIKDATGGTSLYERWYSPSSYGYLGVETAAENNLYNHLLSWVESGMSILDEKNLIPEIVAFCWMQGENDAKSYFDDYTYLWTNFVSDLTAEWSEKGYLPKNGLSVIDGGITDYWTNYSEINYIKETYAEARSKNYFIDVAGSSWVSYDQDNNDYAHLDVAAMIELGKAFGKNVASAIADLVNPAVISTLPDGRWDGLTSATLSGSGTASDPYLISTERDLASLQLNLSAENTFEGKYFKLTEDIVMRHPNFKGIGIIGGAYNTAPDELITAAFSGVFDGDGHSIAVNIKSSNFAALFRANTGTVRNLTVTGNILGGTYDVGGIVGYNYGGRIESCTNKVVLSSSASTPFHYGGVVGYSYGGVISGCNNFAAIVLEGGHTCGGIAGYAGYGATIENCTNGSAENVSQGAVSGKYELGGIVGLANGNASINGTETIVTTVKNSVNYASITVTNRGSTYGAAAGGICGCALNGTMIVGCVNGVQSDSSAGAVRSTYETTDTLNIGGIAGILAAAATVGDETVGGSIQNCTNYAPVSGGSSRIGGVCGTVFSSNSIEGCKNYGAVSCTLSSTTGGKVAGIVGEIFTVNITDCHNYGNVTNEASRYTGGIFGYTNNDNVIIDGCTNEGTISGRRQVGGIGGTLGETANKLNNVISNCTNSGTVKGNYTRIGGIVGFNYGGTVTGCVNTGDVFDGKGDTVTSLLGTVNTTESNTNGSYAGLLVGYNTSKGTVYVEDGYYNGNTFTSTAE